ncbi:glutathione S-transferase 1-1-like [Haemaphysalis longicornis]
MVVELYNAVGSPPCTFVRVVAKKLGIELTLRNIDLAAKDQLSPEFGKLNPQRTVPTINDNGFILWESRAIAVYFVEKYAPESPLYPKDVEKRATVNSLLNFESGFLYPAHLAYSRPKFCRAEEPGVDQKEAYEKALARAVALIGDKKFLCGDNLTLPDIGLACSLGLAIEAAEDERLDKFPQLLEYYKRVKAALPEYEEVAAEPLRISHDMVQRAKNGQPRHSPSK